MIAIVALSVLAVALHIGSSSNPSPRNPWDDLNQKLARYVARIEEHELVPKPSPEQLLDLLRERSPEAFARALADHQPLELEPGADLHAVTAAYLELALPLSPDWGVQLGLHPHPEGISGWNAELATRWTLLAADAEQALQAWRLEGRGTAHEQVDYRLLSRLVSVTLSEDLEPASGSAIERVDTAFGVLVHLTEFECCAEQDRLACAMSRLQALQQNLEALPGELRHPARAEVLGAARRVDELRAYVQVFPEQWSLDSAELVALCIAVDASLERYQHELLTEVAPRADGALGVGVDEYERLLREVEFSSGGAKALATDALRAFTESWRAARAKYEELLPARVRSSPAYRAEIVASYPSVVDKLEASLTRWVVQPPAADLGVVIKPAPTLWRRLGVAFYLAPGPLHPRRAELRSRFFTCDLPAGANSTARLEAEHTAAHEVYPGHHLHSELARESSCLLRQVYPSQSSAEGWAMYAALLAEQSGYHASHRDLDDLVAKSDAVNVAFGALFEVLIHTRVATPEELLELLQLYHSDPNLTQADLGDRALYPLPASSYFTGLRAILQLRKDLQGHLGAALDRRAFHENLMRAGFVPPDLLLPELLEVR